MPSEADLQTIANLMEQASQPVPVSALIVTSTGITEIRVPSDPAHVAEVASAFRSLKDEVLSEFDAEGYVRRHPAEESDIDFVKRLVVNVNRKLPDGFEIITHDHDRGITDVVRGRADGNQWGDSLGDRNGHVRGDPD